MRKRKISLPAFIEVNGHFYSSVDIISKMGQVFLGKAYTGLLTEEDMVELTGLPSAAIKQGIKLLEKMGIAAKLGNPSKGGNKEA